MQHKAFETQRNEIITNIQLQNYPITLWGASISPYVRKIMIALAEKGIHYEHQEILPKVLLQATGQSIPDTFNKISPLGKIPALQVGDFAIADSSVIAAYLDKKFPDEKNLYPINAEEYAKALWFEHYSDTVLTEIAYKKIFLEIVVKPNVLKQEPNYPLVEHAKNEVLPAILDYLNNSIAENEWFADNEFSMADVAISTQLLALKMSDINIDEQRWFNLNKFLQKIILRDSYKNFIC